MFAEKSISRIFSVLVVVVFILAVTPLQTAHAAFGMRYAKPTASGTGDCSSWANACILQTALAGALNGDEIWVAAGTYKPTTGTDRTATFRLKTGVTLYGGFVGTETERTQRNPTVNVTTLSGDLNGDDVGFKNNSENVLHVVTGATGATLDGFTITAGNANVTGDPYDWGGGMYNDYSSPTLTNVTFSSNTATNNGGGMYNNYSSPTLTNVTFSSNMTTNNGGGMYNNNYSSPMLTDVTFNGNSATNNGGGMDNENDSQPMLTNATFSGNSATYGGGMYSNMFSYPMLTDVTFSGNSATNNGGGMDNENSSDPILTNVTFSGNSATNNGGGMYNEHNSDPTLTDVTFSGNSATNYGGGIYNISTSVAILNTILWGNTAPTGGAQIYNYGTSYSNLSYSVVQGGCPLGSTCNNIIITDPKLGTLGNYGGFTQTIPLLAGSSAIDTGNDAVCPATDQRGVTRPQGAHCDIGAFEYKVFTIFLPSILR